MAPTLVASYFVSSSGVSSSTLTTTSFTPSNGEVLIVKAATWDSATTMGTPTGGSQTYTSRAAATSGGFRPWVGIWSAVVSGSPGSMTVSSTPSASSWHNLLVERWSSAQLAATPVTSTLDGGTGAANATLTTTAANSIVSWVAGDAQSLDPATRAYLSSATEENVDDGHVGTNGVWYYAYQAAATAASQSFGLSAPTGMQWWIAGIEVLDASSAAPVADPTWAPHRLVPPGRISPAGFWVPWAGDLTAVATNAPATEAAGTGSALDAAVALGANAAEAAGAGTALDAVASVGPNAAEATGVGAAQNAVAALTANATEAAGTGSAADAVAAIGVNATEATGTGTAYDATVSTSGSTNAPATEATGTGTAFDAQAAVGANAAEATGTGAAQNAQAAVAANAAEATGTGTAGDALAALAVNADVASGFGSALDATVSTSAQTNAPATEAAGAGTAYDASITLTTFAGVAAATGAAYDATVVLGAPGSAFAGVATGVGTAYDARVRKLIPRPNTGTTSRPNTGITLRP